jgi:hypothetical protein
MIWSGITGWPNSTEVGQLGRYGYQGAAMRWMCRAKMGRWGQDAVNSRGKKQTNVHEQRGGGATMLFIGT